ncbi:nuclear transport factor 2 family protein [Chitinophaga flava]|uniref:Nuclear transport factor 2 family protein n=1 Tax=Chitinophaga flava TaxID=2259036 RepID=A0A365Y3I2_9BACT|nr:nuclear transport factor 2 family protein [Chitinophaga flava]RBL93060.1 nuclear transport factor 2 family protein [Chitinophaga flava]
MTSAGTTVEQFITALNQEDMTTAGALLAPDFKFVGVLGTRDGAAVYMEDMGRMKIKYNIHKLFEDGNDVCVICDYIMGGVTVFGTSWYQLTDGRISSLRAVFDPRPLL